MVWNELWTYAKQWWESDIVVGTGTGTETGVVIWNTSVYLKKQIAALPEFLYSIYNHPPARMIASHIWRITWEDLLPLATLNYLNDNLQSEADNYLQDHQDDSMVSLSTILQMGVGLLQAGMWVYNTRKKTQLLLRVSILSMETNNTLHADSKARGARELCQDEDCSKLRFLKGDVRGAASFWSSELAIYLLNLGFSMLESEKLNWISPAGWYTAQIGYGLTTTLSIYNRGRYVTTLVLPDLCDRHQQVYMKEYPELALSLALSHAGVSWLATFAIQRITSIPPVYYQTLIQFILIAQIGLASHMKLPPPVKNSLRSIPDPIAAYQSVIGFIFDTFALGLKKTLPQLLKGKRSEINWGEWLRMGQAGWNHPGTAAVRFILLPKMLYSFKGFTQDAVIAPNWQSLRITLIDAIKTIEAVHRNYVAKTMVKAPKLTAETLWLVFGTPKAATKSMVKILRNKEFMAQLSDFRRELQSMHTQKRPQVLYDSKTPRLREAPSPFFSAPASASDDEPLQNQPSVSKVIEGSQKKPGEDEVAKAIKGSPVTNRLSSTSVTPLDRAAIIRGAGRGRGTFFDNQTLPSSNLTRHMAIRGRGRTEDSSVSSNMNL